MRPNTTILLICGFVFPRIALAQVAITFATDISLQRSFRNQQQYWAFGQDVIMNWNYSPREGSYASLSYYSNGNFRNQLSATAKSPSTSPQEIFFVNRAQVRLVQVSLGWKHYIVGASNAEGGWNLYSITGFGLLFGKATNTFSATIDTTVYDAPEQPVNGLGHFKRLTLDLGLGVEIPLGADLFFYTEAKTYIPTTNYPSKYLLVNNNAPFTGMLTAGLRIAFN